MENQTANFHGKNIFKNVLFFYLMQNRDWFISKKMAPCGANESWKIIARNYEDIFYSRSSWKVNNLFTYYYENWA